jgi:hypothetical protein
MNSFFLLSRLFCSTFETTSSHVKFDDFDMLITSEVHSTVYCIAKLQKNQLTLIDLKFPITSRNAQLITHLILVLQHFLNFGNMIMGAIFVGNGVCRCKGNVWAC